jgi:hypothetical protein
MCGRYYSSVFLTHPPLPKDIGDEPGFRMKYFRSPFSITLTFSPAVPTYLYNYVGQPVNTVDRVDSILTQFYNTS